MAVQVRAPSDLITDQRYDQNPPDPAKARGRPVVAAGTITNLAADNATSTYLLARIPADAILSSGTFFSTAGWGFATVQVGVPGNPTALINAAKAAIMSPIGQGDAKHGLPAWQQCGLAAAPDGNVLDIIATGPANAAAGGTMPFEIHYRHH